MEQLCTLLDAGYGKLDDMAAFVDDVRLVRAGEVRQAQAVYGSVSSLYCPWHVVLRGKATLLVAVARNMIWARKNTIG